MNVRKAEHGDLSQIISIYAYAREIMRQTGNETQWKTTYPPEEVIVSDIEKGYLHLLFDEDGIQGVFAFLPEGDPVYDRIDGAWLNAKPCAAVHRVASAGRKRGILPACMSYCLSLTRDIKIDTHENNKIMQRQLEKVGFLRCGTVTLPSGESRVAYQFKG